MKGPFNTGDEKMTQEEYIDAVKRNNQRLFLIALSFTSCADDAEDILQSVFLKLWKHNKSFENTTHIDKWLTVVCINESKNILKDFFRRHKDLDDSFMEESNFDNSSQYDLFKTIMHLPEKERTVIHLFYYEDYKVNEIAKLLKISESAVKTRLNRARNKIKENLGDEWINE